MNSRGIVPLNESNICSQYSPDIWQKSKPTKKLATERIAEKKSGNVTLRDEEAKAHDLRFKLCLIQILLSTNMKKQYYNLKKYIEYEITRNTLFLLPLDFE